MTPTIEVLAASLSDGAIDAFETDVRLSATVYDALRGALGLPDAAVRVILADNFVTEVTKYLRNSPGTMRAARSPSSERVAWLPGRTSTRSGTPRMWPLF